MFYEFMIPLVLFYLPGEYLFVALNKRWKCEYLNLFCFPVTKPYGLTIKQFKLGVSLGLHLTVNHMAYAAHKGDINLLLYLHQLECPWDCRVTEELLRQHNIESMKWAYVKGCELTYNAFNIAAEQKDLDTLKWLDERLDSIHWHERVLLIAARGRDIQTLLWVLNKRFNWWTHDAIVAVAKHADQKYIEWAWKNKCPRVSAICEGLAVAGAFDLLKWAYEKGCKLNVLVCEAIARHGDLDMMKWAFEHGGSYRAETGVIAASSGNLSLLQWLYNAGCPLRHQVRTASVRAKNYEMFMWVTRNGLRLTTEAVTHALRLTDTRFMDRILEEENSFYEVIVRCHWVKHGNLEKLKSMKPCTVYFPYRTSFVHAFAHATKTGNLDLLKWLREDGCPWSSEAYQGAASVGHLHIVQWLKESGCPWDADACVSAVRGNQLGVLMWLREHQCPWNVEVIECAHLKGHYDILKWILQNDTKGELKYERCRFVLKEVK